MRRHFILLVTSNVIILFLRGQFWSMKCHAAADFWLVVRFCSVYDLFPFCIDARIKFTRTIDQQNKFASQNLNTPQSQLKRRKVPKDIKITERCEVDLRINRQSWCRIAGASGYHTLLQRRSRYVVPMTVSRANISMRYRFHLCWMYSARLCNFSGSSLLYFCSRRYS